MPRITTARAALHADVDLNELVRALSFSDEQTADAARVHPLLIYSAGVYRVQKLRYKLKCEAALKVVQSDLAKKYRAYYRDLGQKVTEKVITEKIERNSAYKEASDKLDKATIVEEYAKTLLDAYKSRGSSLKIVADLVGAEVYVARRTEGQETQLSEIREQLKKKYPGRSSKEERRKRHDR